MWLLEKIFKKKEAKVKEEPKEETIGFDEVLGKIESLNKKELDKISAEASSIVDVIRSDKNFLITTINDIKTSEIASRDATTDSILKSTREKLTSIFTAEAISIPDDVTLSSLKEMNFTIVEFLKTVEANRKNFYYLSVAFPEKMGIVKEKLVSLEKNSKTVKELIDSSIFKAVAMVSENMDSINGLEKKNVEMGIEIGKLEKEIIRLENMSVESEKELEALRSGEEYSEYINSEKEADDNKKELERTKTMIFTLLSPLYRPLRKFENMLDDKKKSEFIKMFIDDPLTILEKYDELKVIMVELLEFVERDEIIIKGKEKFIKNTHDLIETDVVSLNILKYQDLVLKISGSNKDYPVLSKIAELEKNISSKNVVPGIKDKITEMKHDCKENEKAISYSKNKIQEILLKHAEVKLLF